MGLSANVTPHHFILSHYTEGVPSRCTCGAVLPEDARFCHKCGKPQFEEDVARLAAQEQPLAPVVPPPVNTSVSFGDTRALAVSLAIAFFAFICFCAVATLAPPLAPIVFCVAGFAAALTYSGYSARPLSVRSGARLGWMTGLWVFLIFAILTGLMGVSIADPAIREQLKSLPNVARMPEFAKLLDNPRQFLVSLAVGLIFSFFMATLLAGLGGMIGAKLQNRRPSA